MQTVEIRAIFRQHIDVKALIVRIEINSFLQSQSQKESFALSIVVIEFDALGDGRFAALDARQIFVNLPRIRPARASVITGRGDAESGIWRAGPVFQVMPRGAPRERPVREFIMPVAA